MRADRRDRLLERASCSILLVGLLAVPVGVAPQDSDHPFAFFHPTVIVNLKERQLIDKGRPLAKVLPARDRQLAIFAAVAVDADGDRLASWVRSIEAFKKSSYVLSIGRFSTPPRMTDLDRLRLGDEDLDEIRRCRPGNCGVKLSAAEIAELQRTIADAGTEWRPRVQEAFRRIVLRRVETYLTGGHPAVPPYNDTNKPLALQTAFASIIRQSPFLNDRTPRLAEYLDRYPQVPLPDAESFIYWSQELLSGKAIISATHVSILRSRDGGLPDALIAGKQVFATHYLNASLNVTAIMRGSPGTPNYLAFLNRSEVDVLGGLFGGVIRLVAERRLRGEASEVLRGLKQRLEAGGPPAPTR